MAPFRCDWRRVVEPRIQYAQTKDGVSIAFTIVREEAVRVFEVRWEG